MPVHRRVHSKDEELGRRDITFKPRRVPSMPASMSAPWRWRKRRVVLVIAGVILLYLFVRNIPTDLGPIDNRIGLQLRPGGIIHGAQELREPNGAPSRDMDSEEGEGEHYYNGPIKFYRLATTLHGIGRTLGSRQANKNILFAASSLKSVANLMPMACEMGKWERNYVHLAIMGRDTLPLEDIIEVNGVHKNSCTVYFHDARPDYAEYSSDRRAEVSVTGAMKHIFDFMHPQAMIMDDSDLEDTFFTSAMRKKAKSTSRTLIEIPDGRYEDFLWLTRLDAGSLAAWHRPNIDILVHAPQDSSGGLIRLIKSLERADYMGLKAPRLTVELPSNIEPFAARYLEFLDWPPVESAKQPKTSGLTLRHRIPAGRANSEQASLRFLEAFYPTSTYDNHVLILSTQAEVDPLFLQYLYYIILEYRYSSFENPESNELLGVSLDVPTSYLNGTTAFVPPLVADMPKDKAKKLGDLDQSLPSPFLYLAPSSIATLIFGDKWATFHNFLSNRMAAIQTGKAERSRKLVSETEPAWTEHLLELMMARRWNILHPATPFVTVHNELAQIPEEFMRETKQNADEPLFSPSLEEEPFLTAPAPPKIELHVEKSPIRDTSPLQDVLPFNGDLPELPQIPHLYHTGELVDLGELIEYSERYVAHFRQHLGGCDFLEAGRNRIFRYLSTNDLFCIPGVEPEYEESKEDDAEAEVAEAIAKSTEPNANSEPQKATVETKEEVAAENEAASG